MVAVIASLRRRCYVMLEIFSCFLTQVGAALNFDLLKYDENTLTAFLRVNSK